MENLPQQERTPKMTELKQRALAVALREHQEEARKEYNSDKAKLWSDIAKLEERQKKDAGLGRLLCAVLFEEGEPN
jgi:hypothetical protein